MLSSYKAVVVMLEGEARLLGEGHPQLAPSRAAQVVHLKSLIASLAPDATESGLMFQELSSEDRPFLKRGTPKHR